jgi:hypothetical protein
MPFKKSQHIKPGVFLQMPILSTDNRFFVGDSEEKFKRNLEQKPENWHYRTKAVEYRNNSMGYRAPEFDTIDWNNSAVVFGCSCVYGNGLAQDETISHHLEKIWGIPVINMGVGGSSIPFAFYNQVSLAELGVLPKAVINLWTAPDRHTLFTDKKPEDGIIRHIASWSERTIEHKLYTAWNSSFSNSASHCDFLIRAANLLWADTEYFESTFFKEGADVPIVPQPVDRARDDLHPGPISMQNTAEYIAKNINFV